MIKDMIKDTDHLMTPTPNKMTTTVAEVAQGKTIAIDITKVTENTTIEIIIIASKIAKGTDGAVGAYPQRTVTEKLIETTSIEDYM